MTLHPAHTYNRALILVLTVVDMLGDSNKSLCSIRCVIMSMYTVIHNSSMWHPGYLTSVQQPTLIHTTFYNWVTWHGRVLKAEDYL